MTFGLIPALPATATVSTIAADTVNGWRAAISQSLDTVNGGAYANVTLIDWAAGSAGWLFNGPLTVGSTCTFTTTSGATVTLNADTTINGNVDSFGALRVGNAGGAGGSFRVFNASTAQFDNGSTTTAKGAWTWGQDSTTTVNGAAGHVAAFTWGTYGSATWGAGSTLAINTANATVGSDGTLTVNGTSGHLATLAFGQYGRTTHAGGSADTYANGSNWTADANSALTITAGAFVTWTIGGGGNAGAVTFGANGALTFQSSSATTFATGSTIAMGGTETRTGPTIRSGDTGYEGHRAPTTPAESITALDAHKYDVVWIPTLTGDQSWNLKPPPGNARCFTYFKRVITGAGNAFKLDLRDENTTNFVATFYAYGGGATLANGWVLAFYDGAAWTALSWGGYIGTSAGQPF